jgi:hypothetical protein
MHVHISIFRWKPDVPDAEVDWALQEVSALRSQVPGIVEVRCRPNTSPYAGGRSHIVVVRGESEEPIARYRSHPLHAALAERLEGAAEPSMEVELPALALAT